MGGGEPPPFEAARPQTPFAEPAGIVSGDPGDRGPGGQPGRAISVTGSRSRSAITLVRHLRFTITCCTRLPDRHDAVSTSSRPSSTDAAPAPTPAQQPDAGPGERKLPATNRIDASPDAAVYFCDPLPWQRQPAEHTSGLCLIYFLRHRLSPSTRRATSTRSLRNSTTAADYRIETQARRSSDTSAPRDNLNNQQHEAAEGRAHDLGVAATTAVCRWESCSPLVYLHRRMPYRPCDE